MSTPARPVDAVDRWAHRRVRALLTLRADRPTTGDRAYLAYLIVLTALIVGFPLARAAVLLLAGPVAAAALAATLTAERVTLLVALLLVVMIPLGRFRGPVVPREPDTDHIIASPLPRRLTTARGARLAQIVGIALLLSLAALFLVGRLLGDTAGLAAPTLALLGIAALGVILSTLWLLGQSSARLRPVIAAVTVSGVALAAAAAVLPGSAFAEIAAWAGPAGWAGTLWTAPAEPGPRELLAAAALVVLAALSTLTQARIRDTLHLAQIAEQSARWSAVTTLASTGELRQLSARLGPPPHIGRNWAVSRGRGPVSALFSRDLRGLARTPLATALGLAGAALSGAGVAGVLGEANTAAVLAAPTALLAYFSAGALARGLRLFLTNHSGSSPSGMRAGAQALAHTLVPAALGALAAAAGAFGAFGAVGGGGTGPLLPVLAASALLLLTVAIQACSAARGDLPLALLLPIPTAVGDISILNVAAWHATGLLLAAILGGGVLAVADATIAGGAFAAALALAVVVAWTAGRIRQLTQR